jgi:ABC-type branched-subunit amino acid transport system permease subunit
VSVSAVPSRSSIGWPSRLEPFRLELTSVIALLVLFLVPTVVGNGRLGLIVADLCCVYVIVSLGLNITIGYLGQISVAQAALTAVGGYSGALLVMRVGWPWEVALPAAAAIATGCGALLGLLTNRVRTHYLILITLAFHTAVLLLIVNVRDVTGGPIGLYPIPPLTLGPYVATGPGELFYPAVVLAVFFAYAGERLRRSRVGLAMRAVKENERGAQATGIDPAYYRILGMSLSGLYAGVGGVLFASLILFLGPSSFDLSAALFYIVIIVLGGMGNTLGVIAAAVVLTVVSEELSAIAEYRVLIYGVLVMVVMAVAPGGLPEILVHGVQSRLSRMGSLRRRGAPAP